MRLIDADTVRRVVKSRACGLCELDILGLYTGPCASCSTGKLLIALNQVKPIDPEDLRPKGKWVSRYCKWACSECNVAVSIDGTPLENNLKYCPNCGARMEEDNNEAD